MRLLKRQRRQTRRTSRVKHLRAAATGWLQPPPRTCSALSPPPVPSPPTLPLSSPTSRGRQQVRLERNFGSDHSLTPPPLSRRRSQSQARQPTGGPPVIRAIPLSPNVPQNLELVDAVARGYLDGNRCAVAFQMHTMMALLYSCRPNTCVCVSLMRRSEITFDVEHCVNCRLHAMTTRHAEEK